jgi:hypothetical protein
MKTYGLNQSQKTKKKCRATPLMQLKKHKCKTTCKKTEEITPVAGRLQPTLKTPVAAHVEMIQLATHMQLRVKCNQKKLKTQTTDKIKNGELAPLLPICNGTEKNTVATDMQLRFKPPSCDTHETEILNRQLRHT